MDTDDGWPKVWADMSDDELRDSSGNLATKIGCATCVASFAEAEAIFKAGGEAGVVLCRPSESR